MKRILVSVVLTLLYVSCYAQTIKGVVLDKNRNIPIPYVSIGIINTSQGAYAHANGQFEMEIVEFKDDDSLRFSCIGYSPVTFKVSEFLVIHNSELDTIFLSEKIIELAEFDIESKRNKSKKVGNKISTKQMIIGFISNLERGIIIENDTELFFKSVSFKLTMDGGAAPDSAVFRFNIYKLENGVPNENILSQPIYFHLKGNQFEGKNEFDISKFNITISEDFAATFELIKKFGGNRFYFAGWFAGNRSISKKGIQGAWIDDRADKENPNDKGGRKMYQSLEIEVLYED